MNFRALSVLGSLGLTQNNSVMAASLESLEVSLSTSFSPKQNESFQVIIPFIIPRDEPEECNVKQLQRWLLCRGAKTTGKKEDLVQRLVKTNINMLSPKLYLIKKTL